MAEPPVRRNTILLSASMAANSAMLQLSAAVATLTVVLVVGVRSLVGLGPAIVLGTGALSALPAGRAMDRFGRVPVLVTGFALGIAGGILAAVGAEFDLAVPVLVGLVFVGAASATALLARTAAGDMYPPSRRARGISFVLFGAVFGAILGPTVFSPLLAGKDLDADALVLPWLAASAFMVLGLVLVASVRPDPSKIARMLAGPERVEEPAEKPAELAVIIRRPGVLPSMVAAMASFSTMVGIMTLTGVVVVDRGHPADVVFPIIGAHVVGMYALVIVVGDLIDRIGRTRALVGGLALMAASAISLIWFTSVATIAFTLFALGLGWSSFVAATAQLADRTSPVERGKVLGLNDLLSGLTGAALVLIGGFALDAVGVAALALGGLAIALAPAGWIVRYSLRVRAAELAPSALD
jgi:MFS family permease